MCDEMDFFIYLLESYAVEKHRLSRDVLHEWNEQGVTLEIYDGYWGYHTERLENAFEDIDSLVTTGDHASRYNSPISATP